MDLTFAGFALLLFAACFLLIEGSWLWWSEKRGRGARRIARRLRLMTGRAAGAGGHGEPLSILKQRRYSASPWLEQCLRRLPLCGRIDQLLLQSGLRCSTAQFLAAALLPALTGPLLPLCWSLPWPAALASCALGPALPYLWLLRARRRRLRAIELQLPDAADFLARALRAGHSFSNVLQMVGAELSEPISGEFKLAYEEINYGVPMNDALQNLATRVPLPDLRYLVVAVLIQRESGGNLAEVLGSISRIIRARLKLLAQVRVMAAEGKMSAWILGLLPPVILGVMALTSPAYISVLWTDPAGIALLWYAAGMIVGGVVWMRSTLKIRV